MTTPEGWIKRIVKEMLDGTPYCYYHMPVQNGMGAPTLDFICCIHGVYVGIETKAPGKKMTSRQESTALEIEGACGEVRRNVGGDLSSLVSLWTLLSTGAPWKPIWSKWYENASK